MKAKVIIENSETTIMLIPENDFEIDVIEKIATKKEKFSPLTIFNSENQYRDNYKQPHILINVKETR